MRALRLTLWAVIAVVLAVVVGRADVGSTLAALLPDDDSHLGREVRFFATQRAAQLLAIEAWAITAEGDPVAELHALRPQLEPLGLLPLGDDGPAAFAQLESVLYEYLPQLLDPAVLAAQVDRLDGDGLRDHLARVRERASDPTDLFAATAAQGDVLGLAAAVLAPLREHLGAAAADQGVIPHGNGTHHLMLAELAFPPDDGERTIALMTQLDARIADAATRGVRIEPVGSHRHFRDNLVGLHADLLLSLPIGVLSIALVLWTLVRRPGALLALHLPALLAALGAVALLVICGQPVPLLLIGFAAGFLGVSIENALHMTVALQGGWQREVRHPLLVGYLTTAVAFAVLMASAISGLRSLGIMVMGGLILALLSSLFLLPDLVRPRAGVPTWGLARRTLSRVASMPVVMRLGIVAVISLVCLPGLSRLRVIDDLRALDGSRPETMTALQEFLGRWDSFESSDFLVAHGPTLVAAQETYAAAQARLGGAPSLVDLLLPAPSVQAERLAAWNIFWKTHEERFTAGLQSALSERGFSATALSRERYRARPVDDTWVDTQTWAHTPFAILVDQLVLRSGEHVRLAAPLADAREVEQVEQAKAALGDLPHAWIASRRDLATALVDLVRSDLSRLAVWMAVAMAALVWLLERNVRSVIAILGPPALALAWCFGLLGWLGVPLSPFSVMVATFVAGIGLDNAVFLSRPQHREQAFAPVLACTVTTMLGVGSLMLAENPILRQNGIALTIGLGCCLIACLLLTPLLMDGWRRQLR